MDVYTENLRKGFNDIPVIKDVTLKVEEGERVAIIGPNGAGKTTLFRLLNLTIMADQGILRLDGKSINGLDGNGFKDMRRRIATIYQQHNLVPRFKVIHNVLSGRLGEWSILKALFSLLVRPLEEEKVWDILDCVGIRGKAYSRTDRLSGGEQQRVAIARALIQNPDLILADEPCASLDPVNGEKILKLLVELSHRFNKTLITTLHCVDFALDFFPRIIGIKDGMIIFDLPSKEVDRETLQGLYSDEKTGNIEEQEGIKLPYCCMPSIKV